MAKTKKNTNEQHFEKTLWQAADKLRKNIDAAEYKHIVLGLIFLKYISDAFEEKRGQLELDFSNPGSEWYLKESQERYLAMEDPDEYRADNVFFVPEKARWSYLQSVAKQPEIGKYLDEAILAIEKENPTLKGVLPKVYALPNLNFCFNTTSIMVPAKRI
jgi:type I restriction enzyme M protein